MYTFTLLLHWYLLSKCFRLTLQYENEREEYIRSTSPLPSYAGDDWRSQVDESSIDPAPRAPRRPPPPPPKLYPGDIFPFPSDSLPTFLLHPSSLPPSLPMVGSRVLVVDPRPNSPFFFDALSEVLSERSKLPPAGCYVFVTPTAVGKMRQVRCYFDFIIWAALPYPVV